MEIKTMQLNKFNFSVNKICKVKIMPFKKKIIEIKVMQLKKKTYKK